MSESPDEQDELHGEGVATPLWVKAFALAALIIVALFVVLLFTGGHGPGRHADRGGFHGAQR